MLAWIVSTPAQATRPPRRFFFRLLAVMVGCALLPLLLLGLALERTASGAMTLSLAPLDPVLERAQRSASPQDQQLAAELRETRLNLLQAELARQALERRLPWIIGVALLFTAALALGASIVLGRAVVSPIDRLAQGRIDVAAGAKGRRVPESRVLDAEADELELLVRQFNRMSSELAAQGARLEVTQNLAAWQDVARGLAHELKNPLTAMKLALARVGRVAEKGPGADDAERLREATALLTDEIELLLRMTESFSQFAKLPPPSSARVELGALAREVCALWGEGAVVPVECVVAAASAEAVVRGDPDQLKRLLGNLIKNALEASTAQSGPVQVEVSVRANEATVSVRDRGAGIGRALEGPDLLRGLGSTKPQGSGLGLPIAHKIAHDHGGRFRLSPREGGGTEAQIVLPLAQREAGAAQDAKGRGVTA
ncbi:MAG: HAMP domain-containing protein [Deltaproteobacteria bacterium]|nr:HAMP domain-containing protein [Deltaproteobacteria bacterium]